MHEARIRARAPMLPRAFIEEMSRPDADDAGAHAAAAGLVVLRVVDRWVADGCPEGFDVAGAREMVAGMAAGQVTRALLGQVLDAVDRGGASAPVAVCDELLKYGKALELDAKWSLALAVYDAIVSHAGAGSPDSAVAHALTRQGYCLRTNARFKESRAKYLRARRVAERNGDLSNALLAALGCARTDAAEGLVSKADRAFRRIIDRAKKASLAKPQSMALHERAVIAGESGDTVTSTRLAFEALQLCDSPSERDRILSDIGENFRRMGLRDSARDAFLVLSCTSRDQYSRWMALIHLMRIAGDDGAGRAYGDYRRLLEREPLPGRLQIELELQSGHALRSLGQPVESRKAFRRAAAIAGRLGYSRELEEITRAAADESDSVDRPPSDAPDLGEIVAFLRAMRETAAVD